MRSSSRQREVTIAEIILKEMLGKSYLRDNIWSADIGVPNKELLILELLALRISPNR